MDLLPLIFLSPLMLITVLIGLGGGLNFLSEQRQLRFKHREKMAELEVRAQTAKALAHAPEEAQRNELAKELLEAYGEAGEGLKNDEKSEIRWSIK